MDFVQKFTFISIPYLQVCSPRLLITSSSCLCLKLESCQISDIDGSLPSERSSRPVLSPVHLQIPVVLMACLDMSWPQHRKVQTQLLQNIRFERVLCLAWCVYILLAKTFLRCHCPRALVLHNSAVLACPTNLHADHGIDV